MARLIAHIAQDPHHKLRYRIGGDAHVQFWLSSILPWKLYEKLVAKVTKIG